MAVIAYAVADVMHEGGHTAVSRIAGVRLLSISTVALQTAGRSRFASAAGTTADVVAGALALAIAAARTRTKSSGSCTLVMF